MRTRIAIGVLGVLLMTAGMTGLLGAPPLPFTFIGAALFTGSISRYVWSGQDQDATGLARGLLAVFALVVLLYVLETLPHALIGTVFSIDGLYVTFGFMLLGVVTYSLVQLGWIVRRRMLGEQRNDYVERLVFRGTLWMFPFSLMAGGITTVTQGYMWPGVIMSLLASLLVLAIGFGLLRSGSDGNGNGDGSHVATGPSGSDT